MGWTSASTKWVRTGVVETARQGEGTSGQRLWKDSMWSALTAACG